MLTATIDKCAYIRRHPSQPWPSHNGAHKASTSLAISWGRHGRYARPRFYATIRPNDKVFDIIGYFIERLAAAERHGLAGNIRE